MERPFPAYKGSEPYIFVSYSHEDAALVYPEITRLRDQGFNIWYDEGISPGATWRDEIAAALTQCRVFLLLVTPRSAASSNCLKEVNFALSRERRILAIHLEKTQLPVGLELSLSDMQAIVRADHSEANYQAKVQDALRGMLPRSTEQAAESQSSLLQPPGLDIYNDTAPANSIAILPLVNRNMGEDMDYLGAGISEELIGGLSKVPELKVASQMASFRFKGKEMDPKELGQLLGVKSILGGSLQRAASRVRVNILLSSAEDGSTLWSQRYEGDLDDIFALQDDVAANVVDALRIELGAAEKKSLIDTGTRHTQAYDLYLLGKYELTKHTQIAQLQAINHFERAAQLDPTFAKAYWELAGACLMAITFFGLGSSELGSRAEAAYSRAVELGVIPLKPLDEFKHDLNPENPRTVAEKIETACDKIAHHDPKWFSYEYMLLGLCLAGVGLFKSGIRFVERYHALSQYKPGTNEMFDNYHFWCYAAMGDFAKTDEILSELIEIRPDLSILVGERALLYSRTGQYQKAEQDLEYITRIWPRNFAQFYQLFWKREIDAARAYYNWLDKRRNLPTVYKIWGSFLLGDMDRGLDYLEKGIEQGLTDFRVSLYRILPPSTIQDIENHPRFHGLLQKQGMDEESITRIIDRVNQLSELTGIEVRRDEDY